VISSFNYLNSLDYNWVCGKSHDFDVVVHSIGVKNKKQELKEVATEIAFGKWCMHQNGRDRKDI